MTIDEFVKEKGIERILHFTTTTGLLGMLATWSVKSRLHLPNDSLLEYIYRPNASTRKDTSWLNYVNLSITNINGYFFQICATKWHTDKEWCVLSFIPSILSHPGVVFATTNNMYSDVVRSSGIVGLQRLYESTVRSAGNCIQRNINHPMNYPTCSQAEVLYPSELSLNFVCKIYLQSDERIDDLLAQLAVLRRPNIDYEVDPSIFTPRVNL